MRAMRLAAPACVVLLFLIFVRSADAQCTNCLCEIGWESAISGEIDVNNYTVNPAYFNTEMSLHETLFMDQYFFVDTILDAMQSMAEQLTSVGMEQMTIIGGFLDAQQQLAVQRLFEEKTAEAHRDYQPSLDLCTIGTAARGLGSAAMNGELSASILGDRLRDREIVASGTVADSGGDLRARTLAFLARYCNPSLASGALAGACATAAPAAIVDRDVSVHRTVWQPQTLNLNFADTTATDDEKDVLALHANLYGHLAFPMLTPTTLNTPSNQTILLDERAIMAKRSVAENSFAALVGMKTQDASNTNDGNYVRMIYSQLGLTADQDRALAIGNPPSYYALMETLTKKVYEDPAFYTNLYDTPANVARKGAAIRAIDLMQHWDTFNSHLRSEAILAELVELEVEKVQDDVENRMNSNVSEGAKVKP